LRLEDQNAAFGRKNMPTSLIHAQLEDLDTAEKRGKYTVCIVGCGQLGVLQALLFADAGFKVICFDTDQTVVNNLMKGKMRYSEDEIQAKLKNHVKSRQIVAMSDMKEAISKSSIVLLNVSPRIDSKKKIDYSSIEDTCKKLGQSLACGSLIIITKPMGIDIFESTIRVTLENASGFKIGIDYALAYSPLGHSFSPRIVAAPDKNSLDISSAVLGLITKSELKRTNSVKAAAMATLFAVQRQDVNAALSNELAQFCEKTKVDYLEVSELLQGSGDSSSSVPTLSSTLSKEELYLLLFDAENLNQKLHIVEVAREINEQAAKRVANLVKDALRSCGKTPRRARIALLGLSETPNMKGHSKRIVREIAQMLLAKGSRINVYDPYFSEDDFADSQFHLKKSLAETAEGADCIVVTVGHDQFRRISLDKLKILMKRPGAIVDLEGIFEPDKVEKRGFIYRGLGRGVWTK
jgi:nucleotide sugar dehydrogenase